MSHPVYSRRTKSARSSSLPSSRSFNSYSYANSLCETDSKGGSPYEEEKKAVVIRRSEYERIKSAAVVLSKDEKIRQQEANLKERERIKHQLEKQFLERTKQTAQDIVEMDDEMTTKARELREKVEKYRQEQEDDIRRLNEVINEAKCLAVRENQILEKRQKTEKIREMECKLDRRLEEERLVLDKRREELDKQRKEIRKDYADKIRHQIEANDALRNNVEKKMREWDAQVVELNSVSYQEGKVREISRKKEQQQKLREGLQECVAEKKRLQGQQKEQEGKILRKMQEYSIQSAEWRRMVNEAEKRRTRAREVKSTLLTRLSEESNDNTEKERILRTRRIQEKIDREWRLRQLQEEKQKLNERQMLMKAREEQIAMKQKEREKGRILENEEHERILRMDNEAIEIYNAKRERQRREALEYATKVRQQIQENEERLRLDKEERFRDAQNSMKLNEDHKRTILQIKAKKLQELKTHNIPEKYLKDVARKSCVPWRNIKVDKRLQ